MGAFPERAEFGLVRTGGDAGEAEAVRILPGALLEVDDEARCDLGEHQGGDDLAHTDFGSGDGGTERPERTAEGSGEQHCHDEDEAGGVRQEATDERRSDGAEHDLTFGTDIPEAHRGRDRHGKAGERKRHGPVERIAPGVL